MNKRKPILLSQSITVGADAAVSRWSWNANRSLSQSLMASPLLYPHICAVSRGRGGKVADISSKLVNFYRAVGPMLAACCRAETGPYLCDSGGTQITLAFELWCLPQRVSSDQTLKFDCVNASCELVLFPIFYKWKVMCPSGQRQQHQNNGATAGKCNKSPGSLGWRCKDLRRKLRNLRCCWFPFLIWCQSKNWNTSGSVSGWNKINQAIFSDVIP